MDRMWSGGGQKGANDRGCKNVLISSKKLHGPRRHDGLSIFLLYRVWSQPGAQPRTTLSDLNGQTIRITARALHARIAAKSGLMPTMFMTRVRL
jgi:hypothetical protein